MPHHDLAVDPLDTSEQVGPVAPGGMKSVTVTVPVAVSWVVRSTRVSCRYSRVVRAGSAGVSSQRPCSGPPRIAAKLAGESKCGRHSQSTEPDLLISALPRRSLTNA